MVVDRRVEGGAGDGSETGVEDVGACGRGRRRKERGRGGRGEGRGKGGGDGRVGG